MNELLKNKILNNSFSKRNDPAIKATQGKGFDLLQYIDNDKLKEWIYNPNLETIQTKGQVDISVLLEEFSQSTNAKDVKGLFAKYNVKMSSILFNNLNDDFEKNQSEAKDKLVVGVRNILTRFEQLKHDNDSEFRDKSIWLLNIGLFYIKGKINDKVFNAPLVTMPVCIDINKKTGVISIKKNSETYKCNKKLIFYLNRFGFNCLQEIDDDCEIQTFEQQYKDALQKNTSNIVDFNSDFVKLNLKDDNVDDHLWEFSNSVFMSLMDPEGGIILKDAMEIMEKNGDIFEKGDVFWKDNLEPLYQKKVWDDDEILGIDNKLNIYQKYAIQAALKENVIIQGPPGTGKSETIAALILNILKNNKNVLVVSEKKPALDVVMKRLGKLNVFALDATELKDKKTFYGKIANLLELIRDGLSKTKNTCSVIQNNLWNNIFNEINLNLNLKKIEDELSNNDYKKYVKIVDDKIHITNEFESQKKLLQNIILNNPDNNKLLNWLKEMEAKLNDFINNDKMNQIKLSNINLEKINELISLLQNSKKDKHKEYSLNCFLNTGVISKGGLFKKQKKEWTTYDISDLNLIKEICRIIRQLSNYCA